MAAISWLISEIHFRNVPQRFLGCNNKSITTFCKIWADIADDFFRRSHWEKSLLLAVKNRERYNHTMYSSLIGGFTIPSKCLVSEIDMNMKIFQQHIP